MRLLNALGALSSSLALEKLIELREEQSLRTPDVENYLEFCDATKRAIADCIVDINPQINSLENLLSMMVEADKTIIDRHMRALNTIYAQEPSDALISRHCWALITLFSGNGIKALDTKELAESVTLLTSIRFIMRRALPPSEFKNTKLLGERVKSLQEFGLAYLKILCALDEIIGEKESIATNERFEDDDMQTISHSLNLSDYDMPTMKVKIVSYYHASILRNIAWLFMPWVALGNKEQEENLILSEVDVFGERVISLLNNHSDDYVFESVYYRLVASCMGDDVCRQARNILDSDNAEADEISRSIETAFAKGILPIYLHEQKEVIKKESRKSLIPGKITVIHEGKKIAVIDLI